MLRRLLQRFLRSDKILERMFEFPARFIRRQCGATPLSGASGSHTPTANGPARCAGIPPGPHARRPSPCRTERGRRHRRDCRDGATAAHPCRGRRWPARPAQPDRAPFSVADAEADLRRIQVEEQAVGLEVADPHDLIRQLGHELDLRLVRRLEFPGVVIRRRHRHVDADAQ